MNHPYEEANPITDWCLCDQCCKVRLRMRMFGREQARLRATEPVITIPEQPLTMEAKRLAFGRYLVATLRATDL